MTTARDGRSFGQRAYAQLRSAARTVRTKIRRSYIDLGGGPSDTIMLTGGGRGGTTWVSELINYRNEFRDVFEPFHPEYVQIARPFKEYLYLRPDVDDPRYVEPARAILSGRVHSDWTDAYNRRVVARRRIVKDIRTNLLLPWLKRRFPDMPAILLLRHPGAVVTSRMKLRWALSVDALLGQPDLVEDHLAPFRDEMARAADPFERHVFFWCVENYVPLRMLRHGEIHVAYYEGFCDRPREELGRLGGFLGAPFDESVFARLGVPSSQTPLPDSAIRTGASLTEAWMKDASGAQRRRAGEILSLFGLDRIYTMDSGSPDVRGADALMRPAAR